MKLFKGKALVCVLIVVGIASIFSAILLLNTLGINRYSPVKLVPIREEEWKSTNDLCDPNGEMIANFSQDKNIIICTKRELLAYACNGCYFIFFKKNGTVYPQRRLIYFAPCGDSSEFLIRPFFISNYDDLKKYLKENRAECLLGPHEAKNLKE